MGCQVWTAFGSPGKRQVPRSVSILWARWECTRGWKKYGKMMKNMENYGHLKKYGWVFGHFLIDTVDTWHFWMVRAALGHRLSAGKLTLQSHDKSMQIQRELKYVWLLVSSTMPILTIFQRSIHQRSRIRASQVNPLDIFWHHVYGGFLKWGYPWVPPVIIPFSWDFPW